MQATFADPFSLVIPSVAMIGDSISALIGRTRPGDMAGERLKIAYRQEQHTYTLQKDGSLNQPVLIAASRTGTAWFLASQAGKGSCRTWCTVFPNNELASRPEPALDQSPFLLEALGILRIQGVGLQEITNLTLAPSDGEAISFAGPFSGSSLELLVAVGCLAEGPCTLTCVTAEGKTLVQESLIQHVLPHRESDDLSTHILASPVVLDSVLNKEQNQTSISCLTSLYRDRATNEKIADTSLRLGVCYPGGFATADITTNSKGLATTKMSLPGLYTSDQVAASVITVRHDAFSWHPSSVIFPNRFFGSIFSGSSDRDRPIPPHPDTVIDWDDEEDLYEIIEEMDGFDTYTVTVYCNQPAAGGDRDACEDNDVGHAFLSIQAGEQTIYVGFHPLDDYGAYEIINNADEAGGISDDWGEAYEVSMSWFIDGEQAEAMVAEILNWVDHTYNARSDNCTNFVYDALTAAEIDIPEGESAWPFPYSSIISKNPGAMGEDLVEIGGVRIASNDDEEDE